MRSAPDFEIEQEEFDLTRDLYERLLQRTKHVKVWISYALFESTNDEVDRARDIFERANRYLKEADLKEEVGFFFRGSAVVLGRS